MIMYYEHYCVRSCIMNIMYCVIRKYPLTPLMRFGVLDYVLLHPDPNISFYRKIPTSVYLPGIPSILRRKTVENFI